MLDQASSNLDQAWIRLAVCDNFQLVWHTGDSSFWASVGFTASSAVSYFCMRNASSAVNRGEGYLAREGLEHVTKKVLSCLRNMSDEQNIAFLIWLCGGNPKSKLPELCVPLPEFFEWLAMLVEEAGINVKSLSIGIDGYSLELEVGAMSLCIPDVDVAAWRGDIEVAHIRCNKTDDVRPLHRGLDMLVSDVGVDWALTKNYSLTACTLSNKRDGRSTTFVSLFSREVCYWEPTWSAKPFDVLRGHGLYEGFSCSS